MVHAADRAAVHLVIAVAVHLNMMAQDVDISAAFLHEPFAGKEPLYLHPLSGFDGGTSKSDSVLRVARNIYGIRNAP